MEGTLKTLQGTFESISAAALCLLHFETFGKFWFLKQNMWTHLRTHLWEQIENIWETNWKFQKTLGKHLDTYGNTWKHLLKFGEQLENIAGHI